MSPDRPMPGRTHLVVPIALFLSACTANEEKEPSFPSLALTSSSFVAGGAIPALYTADGNNVSPALAWSGLPAATKSLALVEDDPDAPSGTWAHWILYNFPAST